jgi:hypothetical protein
MIGSGLLGGGANFLLLYKDDPEYAKRSRSFVLGLVASFLAPLLLKTVSSDLVDKIITIRFGSGIPFEFFEFASFCLLAAIFSRTLAESVAKQAMAEIEKAKRGAQKAAELAALAEEKACQAEPVLRAVMEERTEPAPDAASSGLPPSLQDLPVTRTDRELLQALFKGPYAFRTVNSLAAEIQTEQSDAVDRLEKMRDHALAGKKTTPTRDLWFLTDKGCHWLEAQGSNGDRPRDAAA